jgi:predicted oxidoreductase
MRAEETAAAFHQLRSSGKVRYFGVSNFTPSQIDLLSSRLELPLVANQVEISVLCMDSLHDGTLDQCQQNGITPMAWSPLGGGRLFTDASVQVLRLHEVLSQVGNELGGASPDQVALAWLIRHPSGIVPVIGSGKRNRIESAARAVELDLTREQWFRIWCASSGHEVP